MMPFATLILIVFSFISWASFAMAIMWQCARPAEPTWLMTGLAIVGTLFGLLQVTGIVWTPTISVTFWLVALLLYGSALSLFWWGAAAPWWMMSSSVLGLGALYWRAAVQEETV
jgi:hypothetical protein